MLSMWDVGSFFARTPWHGEVPRDAASASVGACHVPADVGLAVFWAGILASARSAPGWCAQVELAVCSSCGCQCVSISGGVLGVYQLGAGDFWVVLDKR